MTRPPASIVSATYAARTSAVNVTLDGAPNDGQSGENDLVKKDVENVTTGSGNDTSTLSTAWPAASPAAAGPTRPR